MSKKKFSEFVADAKKIIKQAEKNGIKLADGYGKVEGKYELSSDLVSFNGLGDQSFETCYIQRVDNETEKGELSFNFCKTAHRPYDDVVVAVLATLKEYFPKTELSSDGRSDSINFERGEALAKQALGRDIKFKF